MSWIQNLRDLKKIAINNVLGNSYEYFLERCYRYYSKEYHTPLHVVKETITPHEAILIFYEDKLEDMQNEEIVDLRAELFDRPVVTSGDVKKLMEELEAMDDEAWIAQQNALLKKQEEKNKPDDKVIKEVADEAVKKLREKMGLPSVDE
jgi:Ser-tRNA(Ala) deacylase AlaX